MKTYYSIKKIIHYYDSYIFSLIYKVSSILGLILYFFLIIFPSFDLDLFAYIVAYILLGYSVVIQSIQAFFKKDFFNENSLMTIATLGAFVIGSYTEAVGVMLFYRTGEYLQDYAITSARQKIKGLLSLKITKAYVKKDDLWVLINPEDLQIHDIILVKKGEQIPIDGIVIKGQSYINTSSLTGESLPTNVTVNSSVYSGTINMGEAIEIKVTKYYKESSLQKLIELVQNAKQNKSTTEKFITKFARKYTPIVFFIAFIVFFVPTFILGYDWQIWLEKSIIFLVVSCPCALVVSIPLTFFSGIGTAARQGVLIKSSQFLEILSKIKVIFFDKTGTLTKGDLTLNDLIIYNDMSKQDILARIALIESYSSHPIAESLVHAYKQEYKELPSLLVQNIEETIGKGLKAQIKNDIFHVGSLTFIKENNIPLLNNNPLPLGIHVYIAMNSKLIGIAIIKDVLKPDTLQAIQEFKKLSISTGILSGDNYNNVKELADQLGITTFYADLKPEQKVNYIKESQNSYYTAFIGDGLNDAAALSTADLGIAMGDKGADLSIEVADMVSLNGYLSKIPVVINTAKKTLTIARQNITLVLIVKISIMVLTIFGLSNLWEGILSDIGITLVTIVNALRIIRYKK